MAKLNDGFADMEILDELLISDFDDSIRALVENIYLNATLHYNNNGDFLQSKAIWTSNIDIIDQINYYILSLMSNDKNSF